MHIDRRNPSPFHVLSWLLAAPLLVGCADDTGDPEGAGESTGSTGAVDPSTSAADPSTSGVPDDTTGDAMSTSGDGESTEGGETTGEPDDTTGGSTGEGTDGDSTGDEATEGSTGAQQLVTALVDLADFSGNPLESGELCTEVGCGDIIDGQASVQYPADSETEMWVVADGYVAQHFPFVSGSTDEQFTITAPTVNEAIFVAGLFGVTIDFELGIVAQAVFDDTGITPSIDATADGPYYLGLDGAPLVDATSTGPGAFYIFYNVEPGDYQLQLPGCGEGDGFWGTPDDEIIDVHLEAGDSVGLPTVMCE